MKLLAVIITAAMSVVGVSAFVDVEAADLPDGLIQLKYIESDFGCGPKEYPYIDTGYCPTNTTIIDCEVEISTNQRDKWAAPFGMCAAPDKDRYGCATVFVRHEGTNETGVSTHMQIDWSANRVLEGKRAWMRFDVGKGEFTGRGDAYVQTLGLTNIAKNALCIFGRFEGFPCQMKLYSFMIWEGNEIVHDYIPCRRSKSDGEDVGLYDLVSRSFCANSGGKAFIPGPSYNDDHVVYSSATDLLERFKKCEVKPSEVLIAQMSRVVRYNGRYDNNRNYGNTNQYDYLNELDTFNAGKVNAVTFDKFTTALKEARDADEIYEKCRTNDHDAIAYVASHPLLGITVGMKDDFETKGWVKDGASLVMYAEGYVTNALLAKADDDVCERLRAAGAIFPFQTTVPEFCASCTTWSRVYGVTRNPWNLHYSVGGSSGGSGAALAAGFCTLATGTDMGGSIRIPAAMNGVYGFRPPFGRVPTTENAYCANGPMARTFPDLVLMQNVICGPSEKVHSTVAPKLEYPTSYESISNQTVAVCRLNTWLKGGLDATVNKSMDEVVKVLTKAGAKVIEIELPSARAETVATYAKGLLSTEIGMIAAYANAHSNLVCRYVTNALKSFSNLGPSNVLDAATLMTTIHVEMQTNAFRKGCLAVVMPTLPTPFMPADLGASDDDSKKSLVNTNRIQDTEMLTTSLWNLASRFPVVNVPVTLSDSEFRLPIGVQVIGNVYADLDAFRVADTLSKELETKFYKTRGVCPDFREQIKTNAVKKISKNK